MRSWLILALLSGSALAAPSAELVVTWMPGHTAAPFAAEARTAGAAAIDLTPSAASTPSELPGLIARGASAYDALRFDEAWTTLEAARALADQTGARGATRRQLADLFIYRGLVRAQRGEAEAWDELVAAMAIDATRTIDPARFAPRVIDELDRARAAVVAGPHFTLRVVAPDDCTVAIDGDATAGELARAGHWVATTCTAHAAWGARIDLASATVLTATPTAIARPDDRDILVQARAAGARAVAVVEAQGAVVELRLISADGRERTRRLASWAEAPAALHLLLAGESTHPWYASRWVWAAGAAIVVAAVLVPITAAIAGDHAATSGTVRLPGVSF